MSTVKIIPYILFFGGLFSSVFAQNAAQSPLSQGKALVQAGKWAEAIGPLKTISQNQFSVPEGEKASVLLVECYLREHKRAEAQKVVARFLEFYSASVYRERMEVASATLQIENGAVYEGVETLLRVLTYTKNPAAYVEAKDVAIQTLAVSLLSAGELFSLLEKYPVDREINGWLHLQLGRETQKAGRYRAARYWYKRVIDNKAPDNLIATAEQGLASLENFGAGIPTVLVLAPLSGELTEFGTAAIQGVLLAFDQANLQGKVNIRLADTRADAATALRRTQQAVNQDSVIAIIGPIMSAPAATVAAWLGTNFPNIPMLTPTATDEGIAHMGGNIFQINVSMDYLAESIAEHAIQCLGIREFAVMSPVGDYGNAMAQSFIRAVESRGGLILAHQEFEEGRPDYKTEFDLLRNVRFKQENRKRNIAKGLENLDAMNGRERKSSMSDSVLNFPGIFIPSSNSSDAGLMAGQVAFHKLSGTLLGTSGWYGRDLLVQGKRLVEGSYFSVPSVSLEESTAYKNFAKEFQKKWNVEPSNDKVSGLSYDAANIIFSSISTTTDGNLAARIREVQKFPGIYGEIKFKNGANVNVRILTVDKGLFVEKKECASTRSN